MQAGAERRAVEQLEGIWRLGVGRNNSKASDRNGAWAENPDGIRVAAHGRSDGHILDMDSERAANVFRRDAVGHQRRQPALVRELDIERAKFDKPIERSVADLTEVYPVRHGSSLACDG